MSFLVQYYDGEKIASIFITNTDTDGTLRNKNIFGEQLEKRSIQRTRRC